MNSDIIFIKAKASPRPFKKSSGDEKRIVTPFNPPSLMMLWSL
jgi:hypothetical protein